MLSFIWLRPELIFKIAFVYPYYSLLVLVSPLRDKISFLNILFQFLTVLTSLVIILRHRIHISKQQKNLYMSSLLVFFAVGIYGFLLKSDLSILIQFLGLKFLVLPWFIASFAFTGHRQMESLRDYLYLAVVLNSFACILESRFGLNYLLKNGLEWGTQLSYFVGGRLRLPGLTTTNFDLSLLSGISILVSVLEISKIRQNSYSSKKLNTISKLVAITALINLYFSATRVGILIAFTFMVFLFLSIREHLTKAIFLIIGGISTLLLLGSSLFIFNSNSLFARVSLWQQIISNNEGGIYGNGIGYASAANRSKYAIKDLLLVSDNMYIAFFLSFGILGLVVMPAILLNFFSKSNGIGRSIIISLFLAGLVTELSDYSNAFACLLIYLYAYGIKGNEDYFLSPKKRFRDSQTKYAFSE